MDWLTLELNEEVKKVFEPRYGRKLTNIEVEQIAKNLTEFVELYSRLKGMKRENDKSKL